MAHEPEQQVSDWPEAADAPEPRTRTWPTFWSSRHTRTTRVEAPAPAPAAVLYKSSCLLYKQFADSPVGVVMTTPSHGGATVVTTVVAGGEAAAAGLLVGDIVHKVNGLEVVDSHFGCALLQSSPAGYVELEISSSKPLGKRPLRTAEPPPRESAIEDPEIELDIMPSTWSIDSTSYREELNDLRRMGFDDVNACLHALRATNGSVQAAVQRLVS